MQQSWAGPEMQAAAVHDGRCRRSLVQICENRLARPLVSFSKACGPAQRQSAHRICAHPLTTVDGLLRGHLAQTAARCRAAAAALGPGEPLLVVQDTTDLNYTSHPATEGLGPIHGSLAVRGLMSHAAVAVTPTGLLLGLVHLSLWARDPAEHGKRRPVYQRACEATALKESQKWLDGLWGAEATLPATLLPPGQRLLVVGDREADLYDLFAAPRQPHVDLLVRGHHPRRVRETGPDGQPGDSRSLPEWLAAAPCLGVQEVAIPRQRRRPARVAQVEIRVREVWLQAADLRKKDAALRDDPLVRVWVVEVRERDAPAGVPPLHWMLHTTQPVRDFATAVRIAGYYRRRWLIEELHLVLKSGFRAERLQIDDAHTLKNTLALLYVVAWRVVYCRDTARLFPELAAESLVTSEELALLEAAEGGRLPTAQAVVRAIAHLAGFPRYPSAGEPGVRALWEGMQRLEAAMVGWRLAKGQDSL